MVTQEKSTMTATSTEFSTTRSRRPLNARMVQNFHLVWLDGDIDQEKNDQWRNSITKLRQVVNTVNTFSNVDQSIDFITDVEEGKTFMMVSGAFSQIIVPIVQDISHVSSVYIFCEVEVRYEEWTKEWTKVKGVYTDIELICEALKQAARECDQNSATISFVKTTHEVSSENLATVDPFFMFTQILKEILPTIDFEQEHMDEFLTYCREQFIDSTTELRNIDKIETEYRHHEPIWWYTYDCFLYSMLNRALRTMEVDFIIKMGFFVRDLHNHIAALHAEQYSAHHNSDSFIVYRGQGLSQLDFDELMKTKGGLMSFNNFLSTSLDRAVSQAFAESNQYNPDLIGVLFEITINPSIPSFPFANVRNVTYYKREDEILFSMHSVFRIGQVKQIYGNNRFYQVGLTLTSDNDSLLHALTAHMREEVRGSLGWDRLGQLMIKLEQFSKAEELYEILLKQTSNEGEEAHLLYQLGRTKDGQRKYAEAIEFYEKALEIYQNTLPANHPSLAISYNNIGEVYKSMGESSKALSYYEQALEIYQKTLPANHPSVATSYNNIGLVYKSMGEYSKALSYYEKTLEIDQKTLPTTHPSVATSYNNIAGVYYSVGDYSKALSYYEQTLEIDQKTLPANHPGVATSYNNIGAVYNSMGESSKALSYYEKAIEIYQKTLPATHPSVATSYNIIGVVYNIMGESSKALSHYKKALEVRRKTLPPTHPDLATSYNNIGVVYNSMGEYSKALSYYEQALGIQQKTLPAIHPDLATSYNNIGLVYYNMTEYSKALSYYEKALGIRQNTLPAIHPDFATSYNNIGSVYYNMSEYSKALSYYEKALGIQQKTLPANHSDFAQSYSNIASVCYYVGEHAKALSYYEGALNVWQRSLPPNHPNLQTVRQNIEFVKEKL